MATRATIQRREEGQTDHRTTDIHTVAARGVAGSGGALPYAAAIQHSFGHHDISGIQAHTGGAAREANSAMGSMGYASGNRVAFGAAPSLHTAAHEAAHVIQQRAGVQLKGGVGEAGDRYERHADSVAELVVQGKSAESLLDTMSGSSSRHAIQQRRSHAVQRRAVQFDQQPAGMSTNEGTCAPASTPEAPAAEQSTAPQQAGESPQQAQALRSALHACQAMAGRARALTDNAGETLRRLQALDEPRLVQIAAWLAGPGRARVHGPLTQAQELGSQAHSIAITATNQVRRNDTVGARASIAQSSTLIERGYGLINTATDRAIGNAGRWVAGLEVTKMAAFAALDALAQANGVNPAISGAISNALETTATVAGEMLAEGDWPSAEELAGGFVRLAMATTTGAVTGGVSAGTADSGLGTRMLANGVAGAFAAGSNNLAGQAGSGGDVSLGQVGRATLAGFAGGAVGGALGGNDGAIGTTSAAREAIEVQGFDSDVITEILDRSVAGAAGGGMVSRGTEAAVGVGQEVNDDLRRRP